MTKKATHFVDRSYSQLLTELADLLEQARKYSARSVKAIMTRTYWEVGRRIVDQEQQGKKRAVYGEALIERLALDLTAKFGRGFLKATSGKCEIFISGGQFSRQCLENLSSQKLPQGTPKISRRCLNFRAKHRFSGFLSRGHTTSACLL